MCVCVCVEEGGEQRKHASIVHPLRFVRKYKFLKMEKDFIHI